LPVYQRQTPLSLGETHEASEMSEGNDRFVEW
jgi:hypothetical protein